MLSRWRLGFNQVWEFCQEILDGKERGVESVYKGETIWIDHRL